MKRIILLMAALVLAAGVAGCGKPKDTENNIDNNTPTENTEYAEDNTQDAGSISRLVEDKTMEKNYVEETRELDGGDHMIPATLCLPKGNGTYPAVVMLHGTGSERDEAGGAYKLAAATLAESYGIATLRIDFMGNGESVADYKQYSYTTAVADAAAAISYLKEQPGIDSENIGVLGWSQGGTIALLTAARHGDLVKSVVTWAGTPDLSSMLTDQRYEEAKKNGVFVMQFDWRDPLNVGLEWCEDVKNTDVLEEFKGYEGPVFAIAGDADVTVDPSNSEDIVHASAHEKSNLYMIEGMDHTFNVFTEEDHSSLYQAINATGTFFKDTLQ